MRHDQTHHHSRLVVADGGTVAKRRRVLALVSKATGGPMPGIDLTDLSALVEMDDLDDFRRMQRLK